MRIALTDIEQLTGPYHFLRGIFEQMAASIALTFRVEHHGNGTHGAVTATSVTTTALKVSSPFEIDDGAVLTPAQLTANQNDYNPPGLSDATVLRLSSDAARTLTGLLVPSNIVDHTRKLLINVGAQNIVLSDADAASSSRNRFACPGAASLTLNAGDAVWLGYDATSERWRPEGL